MDARARTQAAWTVGLYWGAIWGLYEATAGWLVHYLPRVPGTAGVVIIPFAVFCLDRALRSDGGARAVLIAAVTAASIKLVDFCLPAHTVLATVNPAVSMLLQGLAFSVVASRLGLPRRVPSLRAAVLGILAFSAGWRLVFLAYSLALAWGWSAGMLRDGLHTAAGFVLRDALLSGAAVLAVMALVYRGRRPAAAPAPAPVPSRLLVTGVLLLAVAVEVAVGLAA
ncbi:MAG: hypothetical protein RBT60_05420 [Candidatus Krumholzibacteria bacterium]|jgi:hypothetical protein|nr:hypothetical protein [Candidatus Krumholzibacteria bacterium]